MQLHFGQAKIRFVMYVCPQAYVITVMIADNSVTIFIVMLFDAIQQSGDS